MRRIKRFLIIYIFAVAANCAYKNHFSLDGVRFFDMLINFNASVSHYYCLVYLQLIAVAPLLFKILKISRKSILKIASVALIICFFSVILKERTCIVQGTFPDGRALLGGYFLVPFWLGMLFMEYLPILKSVWLQNNLSEQLKELLLLVIPGCICLIIAFLPFYLPKGVMGVLNYIHFDWGRLAYFLGITLCFAVFYLHHPKQRLLPWLGRHSLYIFFWHMQVVHALLFVLKTCRIGVSWHIWPLFFVSAIVMPILMEWFIDNISRRINDVEQL